MPPEGKSAAKALARARARAKAIKDREEAEESNAKRAKTADEETALAAKERRGITSAMLGFFEVELEPFE